MKRRFDCVYQKDFAIMKTNPEQYNFILFSHKTIQKPSTQKAKFTS